MSEVSGAGRRHEISGRGGWRQSTTFAVRGCVVCSVCGTSIDSEVGSVCGASIDSEVGELAVETARADALGVGPHVCCTAIAVIYSFGKARIENGIVSRGWV